MHVSAKCEVSHDSSAIINGWESQEFTAMMPDTTPPLPTTLY